jgi:hypothetical protein
MCFLVHNTKFCHHHVLAELPMSNLKLDHIPLLQGSHNYSEWAKAMRYTLLGEDLWKYITEGTNPVNLLEFSMHKPNFTEKSKEDVMELMQEFMVNNAHAYSYIHQ